MKKNTLEAELYWRDALNEESIYAVYEVKNGKKKFLGGLHMSDPDVLDMCYDDEDSEEVAKGMVLGYAKDGGELLTKAEIKDWIQGLNFVDTFVD